MITGKKLRKRGWPQGKVIGKVLAAARTLEAQGHSLTEIWAILDQVKTEPASIGEGHPCHPVAVELQAQGPPKIRETPVEAPIWGPELIDPQAIHQLESAMRLPVTVAGALMPDAHVGYGIPIGGVVALENAVAPYMVGVDIACRMMISLYPPDYADRLDNPSQKEQIGRIMQDESRFGIGAKFDKYNRRSHPVLDDEAWGATKQLDRLRDKAHAQLGTSGTGNHFVDAGKLEVGAVGAQVLGIEPGTYLAIMSHSGSRGVGATIANYYSRAARLTTKLPKQYQHLAWLPLDTEVGQEYWVSMNLAGRYASANHHVLHKAIAKRLGCKPVAQVENHHNFAWIESVNGKEVVVHRKGATPAHAGELGIIPGSQGHNSYLVRGLGNTASLNSASHGAGRQMSRKQAKQSISKQERNDWLAQRGVELLGSGMDEAPQGYKDINEVLALQADLAEPIATFKPRLVLMADDGRSEG